MTSLVIAHASTLHSGKYIFVQGLILIEHACRLTEMYGCQCVDVAIPWEIVEELKTAQLYQWISASKPACKMSVIAPLIPRRILQREFRSCLFRQRADPNKIGLNSFLPLSAAADGGQRRLATGQPSVGGSFLTLDRK